MHNNLQGQTNKLKLREQPTKNPITERIKRIIDICEISYLACWYIFVRFVGHVTKLVPIRLGEPKEGQQHHNGAVDLPSNQSTTY